MNRQRVAVNVSYLYAELPFAARFEAAAADGFGAIEFLSSEDWDVALAEIAATGLKTSIVMSGFGPDPGDTGRINDPGAVAWWRRDLLDTLERAHALGCPLVHLLAGRHGVADPRSERETTLANLGWALAHPSARGVRFVLEAVNRAANPRYLVHTSGDVRALRHALGEPENLGLLFDTYQLTQTEGDVSTALRRAADIAWHVELVDHPGRHEPGTGRVDFDRFLATVGDVGYSGWLALTYRPSGPTIETLERVARTVGLAPPG